MTEPTLLVFAALMAFQQNTGDGVYTADQAKRGAELYANQCASCHGLALTGGESAPPLTGGDFMSNWNQLTLGDLFERIRTTMPADRPGTLTRAQTAGILAHILNAGEFPAGNAELSTQTEALKQIRIDASTARRSVPTPYTTIEHWAKLPAGRTWGSTSAVDIDKDGTSIWVAERCGANSCEGSDLPPILKFDSEGTLVRSFGAGMLLFPHGICVDADGNIWITDGHVKDGKGFQVFKFSPEGKVLMTLGGPDTFNEPNDVAIAPNGDIFVSDGHTPQKGNARVVKFTKDGKFIKQWGGHGSAPGQFEVPHALAFDSQGRLFVGDRANNRIQIFDQDGNFLAQWTQFGRPSGIYIDKQDTIYVTDSESTDREGYGHNPGVKRGIRIGSAKDGTVTAFIPDPSPGTGATSTSEGVAADAAGNVYGAEVGPKDLKKYVRKN